MEIWPRQATMNAQSQIKTKNKAKELKLKILCWSAVVQKLPIKAACIVLLHYNKSYTCLENKN